MNEGVDQVREQLELAIIDRIAHGLNHRRDLHDLILRPNVTPSLLAATIAALVAAGRIVQYRRWDSKRAYRLPGAPEVGKRDRRPEYMRKRQKRKSRRSA